MGHDMTHHENGFSKQHPCSLQPLTKLKNWLFPSLQVWNSLSQPYLSGSSISNDALPRNVAPFGNSSPNQIPIIPHILELYWSRTPMFPSNIPWVIYPTMFHIFPIPIIFFSSRGSCVTQYHRHNNCAPPPFLWMGPVVRIEAQVGDDVVICRSVLRASRGKPSSYTSLKGQSRWSYLIFRMVKACTVGIRLGFWGWPQLARIDMVNQS